MKTKTLWKISVVTSPEAEDAVTELLNAVLEQPVSSFTEIETGETTVACYLAKKPAEKNLRAALSEGLKRIENCGLNVAPGKISIRRIHRENWAESWKRHFKPLEIGTKLLIKPSWSRRRARAGQSVIVLDPGLSFGTGQHPTTSFCLEQIARKSSEFRVSGFGLKHQRAQKRQSSKSEIQNPKLSFLDIGTGSGILAIAAAKLRFAPVDAFDFDAEAIRVSRANAEKNRVAGKIRIFRADLTKLPRRATRKYDVICANLISNLLISERDRILTRLVPGGVLVLAGILKSEFDQVQNAYEKAGLKLTASRSEKEWRSGAFSF
ncbi:MAG TPA: 50S ribosomal protein L11 methyltransferase [Verrucomicrobiae bacterium]|nr:50S ribosomal protein L11 methyltransferase [Verrucomicrobiae bacterium]